MSTDNTARRLAWAQAVARDRAMPRSAVALAVVLALRYFNAETGEAWPSERTLARDLGITQPNVHMAVTKLVEAGFLSKRSGGPRATSRYAIPRRWKAPLRSRQRDRCDIAGEIASDIASNIRTPEYNPGQNPRPQRRAKSPVDSREGTRRRAQQSRPPKKPSPKKPSHRGRAKPMPRSWAMSDAERAAALEIAAWGPARAEAEFAKFKEWHRDRATRSVSWQASWRTWCENGAEIDRRDRTRRNGRPHDRVTRAVQGAAAWYDKQKQQKQTEGEI